MNNIATKRTVLSLWIAGGLVLLLSIGVALAAGETISHSLVGSAGGQISGGGLILHNAVGQPTAGTVENGISLCSGYLCGPRGDTASPTVEGTTPSDGAVNVPRNTPIVVNFSEPMDTGSVSVLITPTVTLTPSWSNDNARLSLTHAELASSTRYTATVNVGSDLSGNPLANAPYTWVFTTGVVSAPEADLALSKGRIGSGSMTAGDSITYTFTITNHGPTSPITATLVDTFGSAAALADVTGAGCAWTLGSTDVTCTVTNVITSSPTHLVLVVTTDGAYGGPLTNDASVAPDSDIVDPNPANDGDEITVTIQGGEDYSVYLPLVQRQ